MHKLGLKLWSTNIDNYLSESLNLYKQDFFDYIELYVVPNSINTLSKWKSSDIPFIIHAPHFAHGMNLSKIDCLENNIKLYKETKLFADELNVKYIIFHPGIEGNIEETVRQLNIIDDNRILIENKPYKALPCMGGDFCTGSKIEEINYVINNTKCGFCLDIGHATAAANFFNLNPYKYLLDFINLNPNMYHLSDTKVDSVFDSHLHFGQGTLDINQVLNLIPNKSIITIETNKNSKENLDDFVEDINYLRGYKIRKAQEKDLMNVFQLSNDPLVRKNSINQNKIQLEEHKKWFLNIINSKNNCFFIVENTRNEFIAQIRFQEDTNNEYFISISIKDSYRGKGFGVKFLKTASELFLKQNSYSKIKALIKKDNESSLKSFINSDYCVVDNKIINNTEVYELEYKNQ